jgi:hypothetical protein
MSTATNSSSAGKDIRWVPIAQIHPAPGNDALYGPIDPDDPKIQQMAAEMHQEGKSRTLLTLSSDFYLMDGHRRLTAAKLAGLTELQCIIDPILHSDPRFVKELVRYNNQRIKSNDVFFREAMVATSKGDAYARLKKARAKASKVHSDIEEIRFTDETIQNPITNRRTLFLEAVQQVIEDNEAYWPLTARQIHYRLLNNPPLRDVSKDGRIITRRGIPSQDSTYVNDDISYKALIRLLKDARLQGLISWNVIDDPTRPMTIWDVHNSTQPYVEEELREFLAGYSRNLLQSQPNHVELFAEKKTLSSIIRPIAAKYCMPLTVGSGCCSIAPIEKLVRRFEWSGKEKLIILTIADFDPAGIMIARSFAQRLRDYFQIEDIDPRRVALTQDQVNAYNLPVGGNIELKNDVNKETFREEFGEDTYEVEALEPTDLKAIVESAIEQTIDVAAYNHELECEEKDSQFLETKRKLIMEYAASLPSVTEE